jgi:hypothetical protein
MSRGALINLIPEGLTGWQKWNVGGSKGGGEGGLESHTMPYATADIFKRSSAMCNKTNSMTGNGSVSFYYYAIVESLKIEG